MKKNQLLLCCMLLLPVLFYGQDDLPKKNILYNPFSKGMEFYPLQRNFDYGNSSYYDNNDVKLGHVNRTSLDLAWNYFIINNLALGFDFCSDWTGDHSTSEELDRSWQGKLNLTYGMHLTNRVNLYLQAGAGIGKEKNIYNSGNTQIKDKSDIFTYHATMGAPFFLDNHVFFTPTLNYGHSVQKYTDGKVTDNSFSLGLGIQTYLGCHDYSCDMSHGFSHSRNIYEQGNSFIGYYSHAHFGFGNSSLKLNNLPVTQESDVSGGRFMADYNYYIFNYVALGAAIRYSSQAEDPKSSAYKYTSSSWEIMPQITLNAPVKNGWNNTFLQFGAGFGQQKSEVDDAGNKTTDKTKLSSYCGWLGYNDFFTDHLSLTPMVGYRWTTQKDTETDFKYKRKGIDIEIGLKYQF